MTDPPDHPSADGRPGDASSPENASSDLSSFDVELLARLMEITEGLGPADIHRLTGIHRETARRYLTYGKPNVEFMARLCVALGVSVHWLLLGVGPRTRRDEASNWLGTIDAAELIVELGRRWRNLHDALADMNARLGRLEAAASSLPRPAAQVMSAAPAAAVAEVKPAQRQRAAEPPVS